MITLNVTEIELLLTLIREKHGPGYALDPVVSKLQGKLSIMLSAAARKETLGG